MLKQINILECLKSLKQGKKVWLLGWPETDYLFQRNYDDMSIALTFKMTSGTADIWTPSISEIQSEDWILIVKQL